MLSISNHPATCNPDDSDAVAAQPKDLTWTHTPKSKALIRGIFDVLTGIKHCLKAREPVVQWLIGSSASIFGVTSEE